MANILVIQHGKAQLPGRLGLTLRDHGFRLDVRKVALPPEQGGKPLPPDLDNVHGIVSLGGPQNVDEPHPWMEQEKELIRAAHERQLPVIGICLGQQLIAQALGGEVARMETPEVGFHDLSLTFAGQTETILAGIPWESPQFFSHGYAVTKAPPEAAVLAKTALSPNAVFRVGLRTFGFGHHFEADRPIAEAIAGDAPELMQRAGVGRDELARQLDAHYEMFARTGDRLCVNIASWVFPYVELLAV